MSRNIFARLFRNFAASPRVLILGTGKCGSTALFFRIRNSMPTGTQELFEPRGREPITAAIGRLALVPRIADDQGSRRYWLGVVNERRRIEGLPEVVVR